MYGFTFKFRYLLLPLKPRFFLPSLDSSSSTAAFPSLSSDRYDFIINSGRMKFAIKYAIRSTPLHKLPKEKRIKKFEEINLRSVLLTTLCIDSNLNRGENWQTLSGGGPKRRRTAPEE